MPREDSYISLRNSYNLLQIDLTHKYIANTHNASGVDIV